MAYHELGICTKNRGYSCGGFSCNSRHLCNTKTNINGRSRAIVDVEPISADVAVKLIDSAGNLQELYEKLFNEVRKQLEEQKEIVLRLEKKIEKQNSKMEELEEGICTLVEQVRELGQEPKYTKEK